LLNPDAIRSCVSVPPCVVSQAVNQELNPDSISLRVSVPSPLESRAVKIARAFRAPGPCAIRLPILVASNAVLIQIHLIPIDPIRAIESADTESIAAADGDCVAGARKNPSKRLS
jgi:hypothetical protein